MDRSAVLPAVDAVLDAPGTSCATLTPEIKARIRELESGQVLEVRTDDPAAREGVPAWSRLTGNGLIATVVEDELRTRFFVRKK
jgi:TusA-related sulfurtransferase